ncbi:MAG: hypothetical protein WAV41_02405 [Microgenomates group bacterium]
MNYLPQFKIWLEQKGYSDSTSRNYLADLGKYLEYINHLPQRVSMDISSDPEPSVGHILSADIVGLYVSYLTDKNNSSRYLASLRLFCQFALDQHLITQNPFKSIYRPPRSPELSDLVTQYETHLLKHNTPPATIRNYINDLHQYISWLESKPTLPSLEKGGQTFTSSVTSSPSSRGDAQRAEGFFES